MSGSRAVLIVALVAAAAMSSEAQRRGRYSPPVRLAAPADFDSEYHFCRVAYRSGGWGVDYPRADVNLSIRLSELTKTRVSFDADREPNHLVVRLTDDSLFQCPFVMMTEVGGTYLEDDEVVRLREYLLKGGFLWADDFWGSYAWQTWEQEIRKVFPAGDYPIAQLGLDHPLF
ncbi:MAG: DUF4159 domain-containing protein, partial [Vicinamibacterales bacterium]